MKKTPDTTTIITDAANMVVDVDSGLSEYMHNNVERVNALVMALWLHFTHLVQGFNLQPGANVHPWLDDNVFTDFIRKYTDEVPGYTAPWLKQMFTKIMHNVTFRHWLQAYSQEDPDKQLELYLTPDIIKEMQIYTHGLMAQYYHQSGQTMNDQAQHYIQDTHSKAVAYLLGYRNMGAGFSDLQCDLVPKIANFGIRQIREEFIIRILFRNM